MWGDEERKERATTLPFLLFSFSVVRTGIAVHGLGEAQVCDRLVGCACEDVSTTFGAVNEHGGLLVV